MSPSIRVAVASLGALCAALGIAACGETSSTGSYKGESKSVAQTISNFQSDLTANNARKICNRDLAAAVVKKLQASGKSCKKALEGQLREIDVYTLTVESISAPKNGRATAKVKSTWSGKTQVRSLSFLKEGGAWKISSLD